MRIVYLNPVGVIGGAERVLLTAAAEISRREPAAELYAVLGGHGPLAESLSRLGVTVHVLPLPKRVESLGDSPVSRDSQGNRSPLWLRMGLAVPSGIGYLCRLRWLLHHLQPDLIHSNGLKMHLLAALSQPRRAALVWHIHDFLSFRPAMTRLLRFWRRRCDALLAISEAVAEDARRVISDVPVHVIRNAVDLDHFTPSGPVADLDALAGLPPAPDDTLRVGLVATYARWKGHEVFLQAAARIRHPKCRFYIVGGPIYRTSGSQYLRQELAALAESLSVGDRVGFVDFQSDPAPVYRALDVVVHASTRPEPFGLTIAEAMACGRCVVVSRSGGVSELFEDGVEAVGFATGDTAQLVAALESVLADSLRRRRLQEQAALAARNRFDPHRYGEELAEAYRRFMKPISMKLIHPKKPSKSAQTILTSLSQSLK
ncbi:MAG: glycosyltransferase family 4 protein [Gemmatales bacterium]|nr:glycosyltransferase family 4 protein [Gemmatales bacterium]MDW8385607.1 glycosyltransferase family 4 protein [Gemmatales bacterium]